MTNKEAKQKTIGAASDNELNHTINLQLIKLGVNAVDMPDAAKNLTRAWLRKHWGWLTLFQFSNAFNMAINRQLEVDAACYGKFTIEYAGRILSSWFKYCKGSGEIESQYDVERKYKEQEFDRENIVDMSAEVARWVEEIKAKGKIRHHE